MLRTSVTATLAVLISLVAHPAPAGTLQAGTVEVTPSLAFFHQSASYFGQDAGSQTQLQLAIDTGLCVSDTVELSLGMFVLHVARSQGGGSSGATAFGPRAALILNLSTTGAVVPFVGAGAGVAVYSGDGFSSAEASALAPELTLGMKAAVGDSALFSIGLQYLHHSTYLGQPDASADQFGIATGFSILTSRGGTRPVAETQRPIAAGRCGSDRECKGDRVCELGSCVYPEAAHRGEPASEEAALPGGDRPAPTQRRRGCKPPDPELEKLRPAGYVSPDEEGCEPVAPRPTRRPVTAP